MNNVQKSYPFLIQAIIAILSAILVAQVVHKDFLTKISYIKVTSSATAEIDISVYYHYWQPQGKLSENRKRVGKQKAGYKQTTLIPMYNLPSANLEIKFESDADNITIDNIDILSTYGKSISIRGDKLETYFSPIGTHAATAIIRAATIKSGSRFSYKQPLRFNNTLLQVILPLICGFIIFAGLSRLNLHNIPSFNQLQITQSKTNSHSLELDGLRGIAAITVVADHTWEYLLERDL